MPNINTGLSSWKMNANHNRMIEFQRDKVNHNYENIKISFYGNSAFKITTPSGLTIMVDPWRNHPSGEWKWFFNDFPITDVDIGISTHAHYDHDALHRLNANVLLDRIIGTYSFSDVIIHGIADKHSTDGCCNLYDYKKVMKEIHGVDIMPPNNPRSWDNCLVIIETGGLRILHWGDNRTDPPEYVWDQLVNIDILLLPIDDSEHVIGFSGIDYVIERLKPKVIIPSHYYIWDLHQRQSTLLKVDNWLSKRKNVKHLSNPEKSYTKQDLSGTDTEIHFFGDHVMFNKKLWRDNLQE